MQKIDIKKLKGTEFQKKVWAAISKIPKGKVLTYKELATKIGRPLAVRAVGNAVGANPCPIDIPCHRVVRTNGELGGYSGKGGVKTKIKLLKNEGIINLFQMKESEPVKKPPSHQELPDPENKRRNPFEESDDITPHDVPVYDPSREHKRNT